jgi:hypothetical protein
VDNLLCGYEHLHGPVLVLLAIVCASSERPGTWTEGKRSGGHTALLDTCSYHGVLPLFRAELCEQRKVRTWRSNCAVTAQIFSVNENLHGLTSGVMRELAQRAEISRVVIALAERRHRALLLKGARSLIAITPNPRSGAQRTRTSDPLDRMIARRPPHS